MSTGQEDADLELQMEDVASYGTGARCFACKESITGTFKEAGKQMFHDQCLRCSQCKKEQDETEIKIRHNNIYCQFCYTQLFGSLCDKCHKAIESDQMIRPTIENRQIPLHKQCYRCAFCQKQMGTGKQFTDVQLVYCSVVFCSVGCALKGPKDQID